MSSEHVSREQLGTSRAPLTEPLTMFVNVPVLLSIFLRQAESTHRCISCALSLVYKETCVHAPCCPGV